MEIDNNDIDRMTDMEIREMWNALNARLSRLEEETMREGERVSNERIKSAQEHLASSYLRFSRLGFLCAVVFAIIYGLPGLFEYPSLLYHYLVAASMVLFFGTAGVMDYYLYQGVKDINLATMPVTEVRRLALGLKKLHHIFQIILIPLGLAMVAFMTYPIIKQVWFGVVIGGAVGLAIGIKQYLKMMKDYKELIDA